MSDDVTRLAEVIEREVYCTVIIRPEHADGCHGDCPERGCPIPVQDYGDIKELAAAILASEWLAERDALNRLAGAVQAQSDAIDAHAELVARMEALCGLAEQLWESHQRWSKAGPDHRPCEAGARMQFARQIRAALNDPTEETTP